MSGNQEESLLLGFNLLGFNKSFPLNHTDVVSLLHRIRQYHEGTNESSQKVRKSLQRRIINL